MDTDPRKARRRGSSQAGDDMGYGIGTEYADQKPKYRHGYRDTRAPVQDYGNLMYRVPGHRLQDGTPIVYNRCARHAPPGGILYGRAKGSCVGCLAENGGNAQHNNFTENTYEQQTVDSDLG